VTISIEAHHPPTDGSQYAEIGLQRATTATNPTIALATDAIIETQRMMRNFFSVIIRSMVKQIEDLTVQMNHLVT
jgi:hypothetical protein